MYSVDDCPHFMCHDCKFWKVNADLKPNQSTCKRIDHKRVKFWRPFFASYDCGRNHMICADFEPAHPEYADFKNQWEGFDDYWRSYQKAWLTSPEKRGIAFYINDDHNVMYCTTLDTFLYGPVVKDGMLQAFEKCYSKRDKVDHGVQLYKIIREPVDGVRL